MYVNCCDNGETMPSYYLQTLGGGSYTQDWDFTRFLPDAMVCNLGTNDFGHDSGPAWEAAFSSTYVSFVLNATARYANPKLPVFVAQGPMNNGAPLHDALQVAIKAINAAGGNAIYLDLRGPPNDGCGGRKYRVVVQTHSVFRRPPNPSFAQPTFADPGVAGHAGMYELAVPVISAAMGWA